MITYHGYNNGHNNPTYNAHKKCGHVLYMAKYSKKTFFIFTKNFIEKATYHFVQLPSANFRATSYFIFPKLFIFLSKELCQVPSAVFQGIDIFSIKRIL